MSAAQARPVVRVRAGDSTGSSARAVGMRSNYGAADLTAQATAGWMPPLLSADASYLYERDLTVARIRDLARNEPWVQSAVDRMTDMIVGASFRPKAKPDIEALGITQEQGQELAARIDAVFRMIANDPIFRGDAQRRLPFAGQMGLGCRQLVESGEAAGVIRWIEREGWPFATALQIIDTDRLSNPNNMPDSATLRGGVEMDENGAPIAYHFRRSHPGDIWGAVRSQTWDRIERWDQIGGYQRPKVVHAFEMLRPDQTRGVSKLTAALVKTRLLSRHAESEVKAAAINASIVGTFYTQLGQEYAADALGGGSEGIAGKGPDWDGLISARTNHYKDFNTGTDSRFTVAFPSDKLEMNVNPRNTTPFPQFQRAFLQSFAASIGISYEQLSMDWTSTNYSSARAALNEVWRAMSRLRSIFVWSFAQPCYAAILEDAFDAGLIEVPRGAPDFYDMPHAYVQAQWIGPPRGYIDPVKEIQAAVLRIKARMSTFERETAEQGGDIDQDWPQLAMEAEWMSDLGLGSAETDLGVVAPTDGTGAADQRAGQN